MSHICFYKAKHPEMSVIPPESEYHHGFATHSLYDGQCLQAAGTPGPEWCFIQAWACQSSATEKKNKKKHHHHGVNYLPATFIFTSN